MFEPEAAPEPPKPQPAAVPLAAGDDDLQPLSAGALAALCSNLARGCEKQYKEEEAALFRQIADFYTAGRPRGGGPQPRSPGGAVPRRPGQRLSRPEHRRHPPRGDRGTQRICVWGEKVTQMLYALLGRYQREGRSLPPGHPGVGVLGLRLCVHRGHAPPRSAPSAKCPHGNLTRSKGRRPAWKKTIAVRNLRLCTKDCLCLYVCPTGASDTENSVIDNRQVRGLRHLRPPPAPAGPSRWCRWSNPPQQKKAGAVLAPAYALANAKARQEQAARQLARRRRNPTACTAC